VGDGKTATEAEPTHTFESSRRCRGRREDWLERFAQESVECRHVRVITKALSERKELGIGE